MAPKKEEKKDEKKDKKRDSKRGSESKGNENVCTIVLKKYEEIII